ncbi:3-deoxy-D-manno-octulosonic acid transferase, partial [Achromobacter sp. AGC25]
DAIAAGAAWRVADAEQAVDRAMALVADAPRREAASQAARAWFDTHAGATRRTLDALAPWLD